MRKAKNGTTTSFAYTPFGCSAGNASQVQTGFQNMYTDQDDIIVAKNGRLYAPCLRRFLQRDPLGPLAEGVDIQSYSFADNSPVLGGDPTGEFFRIMIASGVRAASFLGNQLARIVRILRTREITMTHITSLSVRFIKPSLTTKY